MEIWRAARQSIGCTVGSAVPVEAQIMVASLGRVRETIKIVEDKIEEICLTFPEYSLLFTIPGFGPDVSAKVLAAIGSPDRFANGRQVLKMAGLDLSADRSGRKLEGHRSSQKKAKVISGMHCIRLLSLARSTALSSSPTIAIETKAYFENRLNRAIDVALKDRGPHAEQTDVSGSAFDEATGQVISGRDIGFLPYNIPSDLS